MTDRANPDPTPLAAASTPATTAEDHAEQDAARFRLAWALAHSKREGDAARAVELLRDGTYDWGEAVKPRDRKYISAVAHFNDCLLYTSPSPRDQRGSRMPSSA